MAELKDEMMEKGQVTHDLDEKKHHQLGTTYVERQGGRIKTVLTALEHHV